MLAPVGAMDVGCAPARYMNATAAMAGDDAGHNGTSQQGRRQVLGHGAEHDGADRQIEQ